MTDANSIEPMKTLDPNPATKTLSGGRLRELREHAGLSQVELARSLDVDKTVISRWESGERKPSLDQQLSLSRVLGITLDYLLNAKLDVRFEFRAKKAGSAAGAISRAVLDARMQIHYLDSAFQLAERLPQPCAVRMDFLYNQIPTIARQTRTTLKLNQRLMIEEFKQALAEINVHVFEWALPPQVSGLSHRDTFTVIFINRLHSSERQLFTLAHEFAHILFHLGRDGTEKAQRGIVSLIGSNREPEEKEANAFAAELVMPGEVLDAMLESGGRNLKRLEALDSIAQYFNVSREAVFYRLVEKGIFTWEEKRFFFTKPRAVPSPPEIRVEDIGRQVAPEFLRMALQVHDEGKISTGKLKEWFFTDRNTLDEYLSVRAREAEEVLDLGGE